MLSRRRVWSLPSAYPMGGGVCGARCHGLAPRGSCLSTKEIYSLECGGVDGVGVPLVCPASRRSLKAFSAVTISSFAGHPYLEKRSR